MLLCIILSVGGHLMSYKKKNNKVAIVALNSTRELVNFNDKSFDFWTLNSGCELFKNKQIKLCSDLHDWPNAEYRVSYYKNILCKEKLNFSILVPEYNEKILSEQIVYPYNAIISEYGFGIENTLPALILYAWFVGYKDIYIFGSGQYEYFEYPEMGASYYQAIGFARGKKCRVWLCNTHALDNDVSYGLQKMYLKNIKE